MNIVEYNTPNVTRSINSPRLCLVVIHTQPPWIYRYSCDDDHVGGHAAPAFIGNSHPGKFEIRVKELNRPDNIVIEWENGGENTQVAWSFEGTAEGETILTIEESGFTDSTESIIHRALDSTGGFNQVIVAAKALIEHGIGINVVADRA